MNKNFAFIVTGFDATTEGELEFRVEVRSKGGKCINYSETKRWVEEQLNKPESQAINDYCKFETKITGETARFIRNHYATQMGLYMALMSNERMPAMIENVIFNDPATIVFWSDGTKTIVKAQDGEVYDPEKGLALAISKKALGNQGNYYNEFDKWLNKDAADESKKKKAEKMTDKSRSKMKLKPCDPFTLKELL